MVAVVNNEIVPCFGLLALALLLAVFVWNVSRTYNKLERKKIAIERSLCTECGYDLRAGHESCPECGARVLKELPSDVVELDPHALSENWPASAIEPRIPWPGETPVVAHSTRNSIDANLLAEQLQARGVWARVEQKVNGQLSGTVMANTVQYYVVVTSDDEATAKAIIETFRFKNAGPAAAASKV
jgi:hypothetical protein